MSANTTIPSTSSTFESTTPPSSPPPTSTDPPTSEPPTTTSEPPPTTSTETSSPPTTTSSSPPPTTTTTTTTTPSSTTTSPPTTEVPSTVTTDTTVTVPPTSTPPPVTETTFVTQDPTTTSTSTSTTSTATIIPSNSGGGGLGTPGTIAIAVIIPIFAVALLLVLGFFFWRKRKARKEAEEQRKNEMAEYGYNPNNDPSLFPAGGAYADEHSDAAADDNSGYRGWGTTNSNARKASTTLGSNSRAGAMATGGADTISQPSGYGYSSPPTNGVGDPLMGHQEHTDEVTALGGAAVKNSRNSQADIQRGVSNASSSYSRGPPHSESSAEGNYGSPQYHEDPPYNVYNDASNLHGPYGDGTYSNDQPIIRDVSARRNTKIERAPTFPQTQGGISQNF